MSSIAADLAQRRDDSELASVESPSRAGPGGNDDTRAPQPSPESSLASQAIQFFATATPATLAGLGVGISAVTYAVLGRIGLVLIGAFGGVVSFIIWESKNPELAKAIRGEEGPRVLDRVWADLTAVRALEKQDEEEDDDSNRMRGFDDFRPETREALSGLVDSIVQNYINWWYTPLVPSDHAFPLSCRKTITSYLLAISNRMCRKRPADAFLDLLTNSTSMIIVFLSELATAFSELPPDTNMSAADTIYNYLAENPDSRLANLLNKRQQATKFKMVSEDLLAFLDKSAYNCDPARIFLREILANSVLEQTLQQCSRAEWINGWIVYLLEAGEPNLNQAIDVGMQTGRDVANNVFADLDGNVGNIGIAKPRRGSNDQGQARRKESAHKKKLSKADEELEEAMEEMKRMNAMIAEDDERRKRASTLTEASERSKQSMDLMRGGDGEAQKGGNAAEALSPTSNRDTIYTPHTPRSTDSASQASSPRENKDQTFTSFDQIVPQGQPQPESDEEAPRKEPLTLHNASFTLHDDGSGDMGKIKSKPNTDYLIQVEPSSSHYPGWMIVRRYSDFETLHEILRRIAAVSGATAFMELHKELPSWKIHTRESLRGELERYLRDACWYQALAESEGMKRFLEKSQGHTHGNSKSFGWETMGKNMLEVLSIGPKGAMEGGKSLVGGVSGVFGNLAGLSRKSTAQSSVDAGGPNANRLSISSNPANRVVESIARSPARSERASLDSQRSSVIATQPGRVAPMERMLSFTSPNSSETDLRLGQRGRLDSVSTSVSARPSMEHSRTSSLAALRSPSSISLDFTKLPPPPDEISDDYESPGHDFDPKARRRDGSIMEDPSRNNSSQALNGSASAPALSGKKSQAQAAPQTPAKPARQYTQLSEAETRVAVELIFAVINEMYTLSSAWNIRRTLLAAAKSFLLRPGNPSLLTVQNLIQSSVIDANTSDAGIATLLRKVRENTMPTEQEQALWPAEPTEEEKKQLAIKARKLLIQSGVPAALMGVMGQSATGEALGRVFDCLQIEEIARGLIFGLILQAARILTH
ncbi:PX domain-containing protein [Trichoderma reesei RUT C-30]|uniref:PX domain-containing protein n=1 Tax=Hypocrea jecorina (strain ATCC 56765 / BCRC 32924 / NRRL 11460 / Rut C-30) TaxID=1344414 RepID=A0A024S9B2_HYPJR|nr:PX domain-containing protein [Trichoderma reesei RUT C-30]